MNATRNRGDQPTQVDAFQQLLREMAARHPERTAAPYVPPPPKCSVCDDAGAVVVKGIPSPGTYGYAETKVVPCPACTAPRLIQQKIDALIKDVHRLENFRTYTYDTFFAATGGDMDGRQDAFFVSECFSRGEHVTFNGKLYHGAVLSGPYGVGKTGIGALALFERVRQGITAACVDWRFFADTVQETYDRTRDPGESRAPTKLEVIGSATSVEFLMIDELGHKDRRGNPMPETPNRVAILETLIAARHVQGEKLLTLITTNLDKEQIGELYGEYLYQRLFDMCVFVPVSGGPLRKMS